MNLVISFSAYDANCPTALFIEVQLKETLDTVNTTDKVEHKSV